MTRLAIRHQVLQSDDKNNIKNKTLNKNPKYSQRELADDLGFSLGKLNYCLNYGLY